ncbi:heterogeneous nuclear ribonucleoprotein 1-like [Phragmites australis]|uniref:heterogeneous nuclear ribonucleoprotein 1-like n=1 Tax=Phragmites australis TaxID=29695 RepID=UPI002D796154|nr:heterogeneous nuclear ribonucleoprotein 1-like [Phragmites australis]
MAAAQESAAEEVGESRKLFVGGIPAAAQEAELRAHFARFGVVRTAVVMRDRETGHGRGFGFVEFEEEAAAASALGDGDRPRHFICGRLVDVKRARTRAPRDQGEQHVQHQQREQGLGQGHQGNQPPARNGTVDSGNNVNYDSKKVFIGGLRDNITEEEFRAYFETFGTVTDAVVIYDSLTSRSRGFGFVTFDSEEAVSKVMQQSFHNLNGTKVEAKIAIPKDEQYYRNARGRGARSSGGRGPVAYEGSTYQPYNARYSLYNGYMPQPVPAQPYFPGPYFGMGGYPYGNGYPNQGVMTNVPEMMSRRIPPSYGTYPQMYPGFNFVYRAGYGGAATSFQNGINGGSDNIKGQTTVDIQEVDNTASIATKLEHMKLGSQ